MNMQQMRRILPRVIGVIGTLTLVIIFVYSPSFLTPDKLVVFLAFVFMIFGQTREMLKRLLPFVALLLLYESFRSVIPHLNGYVNYMFLPTVDKFLAGGQLPTHLLQNILWNGHVQWYDFVFYLTYMMHFVLPFALAIVIWKLRERHYWRYVTAYLVVSFAGFLTFLALPTAPPWMASEQGKIEPIVRISSDVWWALGIHDFPSIYNKLSPNPVAAFPSLHAAYSTLFALFVMTLWKKSRFKWLAWIYPLLIYVGTIYMGEHYLIDEIAGALYAFGAFFIAPKVVTWLTPLASWCVGLYKKNRERFKSHFISCRLVNR